MTTLATPTSVQNTEHYVWGDGCDGWHLLKERDLSVIQERVPPGVGEVRHFHSQSRQYFFILRGQGNPPNRPKAREVEFSTKEFLHEEVKIYRRPDHGCAQTG